MDLQLKGNIAIVTGASRGIGRSIAHTLSTEGAHVVLVARSADSLREIANSCPTECFAYVADLRQQDAAAQVENAVIEKFGRIDILVNNAGATKRGDFLLLTDDEWNDGFSLKFFGAMRLCRAVWPHLQATRGCIVNIVGVGGRTANADFTIGGSVNAALLNLTKALADRGTRDGVRVNAINPGSILTERLQERIKTFAKEHQVDFALASKQIRLLSQFHR
jgi:NAD(P)-dependent dehydrogenase (short-subunit alcohol dehydrogenase family)